MDEKSYLFLLLLTIKCWEILFTMFADGPAILVMEPPSDPVPDSWFNFIAQLACEVFHSIFLR